MRGPHTLWLWRVIWMLLHDRLHGLGNEAALGAASRVIGKPMNLGKDGQGAQAARLRSAQPALPLHGLVRRQVAGHSGCVGALGEVEAYPASEQVAPQHFFERAIVLVAQLAAKLRYRLADRLTHQRVGGQVAKQVTLDERGQVGERFDQCAIGWQLAL